MENIPDHPIIRNCERYGYPYGPEIIHEAICPLCNRDATMFYVDKLNDIIGCEYCVEEVDAQEWVEYHYGM